MVFNILMDNTDDHEKNHALLRQDDGSYRLAPAFDVVPSAQGLGYQALAVGDQGTESTLENALTQCRAFGLKLPQAREVIQQVAGVVENWKQHFCDAGVKDIDIDVLAQYIDGDRLGGQRKEITSRMTAPVARASRPPLG